MTLVRADATNTIDVTVTNGATTTPYNGIHPGQVFGTYFKLVSILADTSGATPVYGADFEYGDQFLQLANGPVSTARLAPSTSSHIGPARIDRPGPMQFRR